MPGSYTFRPVEAKLTHDTELIGKMNPYCAFQLGDFVAKSAICKKGGKNPHWDDLVTIPAPLKPVSQLNVHVMDKDRFTSDDLVGTFSINLNEVENTPSSKWYTLFYKNQPAGEILMEGMFDGEKAFMPEATIIEEHTAAGVMPESKIFQEQKQVVENRTFMKEVDVVETIPVVQNIEVMEPVKVVKDVEYTEVVPVTKQIETIEPQVVKKQVEVIEPKLVTKTIQVVENVPVMKEVEVIESVPVVKEVETFEPQTFTKQVEVTEYVPVSKQVEVTEPVHVKKAVEFVEPVITTQTITKEVKEPVIVHEEVKTTVGPATMIDAEERIMKEKLMKNKIIESEFVKEEKLL